MATPIRKFAATGAENGDILRGLALIGYCDIWGRRDGNIKSAPTSFGIDERQLVVVMGDWRYASLGSGHFGSHERVRAPKTKKRRSGSPGSASTDLLRQTATILRVTPAKYNLYIP